MYELLDQPQVKLNQRNQLSNLSSIWRLCSSASSSSSKSSSKSKKNKTKHLQEALRKSTEYQQQQHTHAERYTKLPSSSSIATAATPHSTSTGHHHHHHHNKSTIKSSSSSSISSSSSSSSSSPSKSDTKRNTKLRESTRVHHLPKPPSTRHIALPNLAKVNTSKVPDHSPPPPPRPSTSHPGLTRIMSKSMAMSKPATSSPDHDTGDAESSSSTNKTTSNTTTTQGTTTIRSNGCTGGSGPSTSSSSGTTTPDWSTGGNFINKPPRGWLHPDQEIAETGVSYAVRYVGCLEINTSMKSLDFDTRSQIAKECISRVCEASGLKTVDKKRRTEKRICRMLSERPNMDHAGSNVNLTITSSFLNLTVMETGEVIACHEMPNISFASGGDADTLDFVAYVAKDHRHHRACFVLECGGGLAQDVITTIGQAFELRFKEFLKRAPRNVSERLETANPSSLNGASNHSIPRKVTASTEIAREEDRDYYNDLPGKMPPEIGSSDDLSSSTSIKKISMLHQRVQPQAAPRSGLKKSLPNPGTLDQSPNLIDLTSDFQALASLSLPKRLEPEYVNTTEGHKQSAVLTTTNSVIGSASSIRDPFDMQPFNSTLEQISKEITYNETSGGPGNTSITESERILLESEEWFHGQISRSTSETLVVKDGDFLVRESQGSPGQYVLTGMQGNIRKHLLLVDPEGVVRTKDKTFDSVSHLINYHRDNGLPIISAESALVLMTPVLVHL